MGSLQPFTVYDQVYVCVIDSAHALSFFQANSVNNGLNYRHYRPLQMIARAHGFKFICIFQ